MALQDKARNLHAGKLTEGRKKGDINELIANHTNGVTLRGADILRDRKRNSDYVVFICEEEPDKFYFGGSVVTNYISELIATCESKEAFDAEIKEEGLLVAFEQKRSPKSGNVYVSVKAL